MTAPVSNPPRCWADGGLMLNLDRPIECQAMGYPPLGLCDRHNQEIIPGWCPPPPPLPSY